MLDFIGSIKMDDASMDAMRAAGVTVVHGSARFLGPRAIDVAGRQLTFRAAIVATDQ